ncbi:MAG: hypothetical protein AB1742_05970, partial [bacterium]
GERRVPQAPGRSETFPALGAGSVHRTPVSSRSRPCGLEPLCLEFSIGLLTVSQALANVRSFLVARSPLSRFLPELFVRRE